MIPLVLVLLAAPARAANPLGPAFVVKQAVPPPEVVTGVRMLRIEPFAGTDADVAAQIRAALDDPERRLTDAAAIGAAAVDVAADVGSQYLGGLVGGGIQGKLVQGVAKNTVTAVADGLEHDPLVLDDGLTIDVFQVVDDGEADATLGGRVEVSASTENYTQKQPRRDKDGNVVKDADGKPVMVEVACKRRAVTVTVSWAIRGGSGADGVIERTAGDARCGDQVDQLASADALAAPLMQGLGMPIVREIAPAWRVQRLPLVRTKAVKDALKALRADDWTGARCALEAAAAANPDDPDVQFDLGVALEAFGHHDAARARYAAAQQARDRKVYRKAAERLDARVAEVAAMTGGYGLTWTVPAEPAPCASGG